MLSQTLVISLERISGEDWGRSPSGALLGPHDDLSGPAMFPPWQRWASGDLVEVEGGCADRDGARCPQRSFLDQISNGGGPH